MATKPNDVNAPAPAGIFLDLESLRVAPFNGELTPLGRLTFRINKQRFVRGKRFFARLLCRLVPQIARIRYDIARQDGLKARVCLDNFHDCWFCDDTIDMEREYRAQVATAAHAHTADDFVFVDIGGNTGIVSAITIKELSRTFATPTHLRCLVIEPQHALVERLATNLKWNARGAEIKLAHCALGDRFDTVSMAINHNNRGGSRVAARTLLSKTVPMVPLFHVLEQSGHQKIDLLKIDVEGYEYPILQPFFATCATGLKPKHIFVEIKSDTDGKLAGLLATQGYERIWSNAEDAFFRLPEAPGA